MSALSGVAGVVAFAMVVASASGGAGARGSSWRIRSLGTLPAPFDKGSEASSLNGRGVVIGWSYSAQGKQRAFVWRDGKMKALPSFGGYTSANAIADNGDVVGEADEAHHARSHPVVWRNGKLADLGSLGGEHGAAVAINDHEQIVGESETNPRGQEHAFLWQRGTMTDLGTLGGSQSQAVAINDAGQVVGTSTTASGAEHAFLWQMGKMTDLGAPAGEVSEPHAIDGEGNVVGDARPPITDPDHALLWRPGRHFQDLGGFGSRVKRAIAINWRGQILVSTFRPDMHAFLWSNGLTVEIGTRYTNPTALNGNGWVIGMTLFRKHGPQVPFVWRNGRLTALPTLDGQGPPTSAAYRINNQGWIVGRSYAAGGDRAVLWTPG